MGYDSSVAGVKSPTETTVVGDKVAGVYHIRYLYKGANLQTITRNSHAKRSCINMLSHKFPWRNELPRGLPHQISATNYCYAPWLLRRLLSI